MLDLACFNGLIAACVRNRDPSSAETWFERMVTAHVQPDVYSFNMLIGLHVDGEDARFGRQRAEFWLGRMQQFRVKPTAHSFTALIAVCARLGDSAAAEMWYQKMVEEHCEPSRATYDAMIAAYSAAGTVDQSGERQQQGANPGIQLPREVAVAEPPALTIAAQREGYDALIKSRSNRGDVTQVEALVARMKQEGLEPTLATVNAVIHACTQGGEIDRAEQYLRAMESGTLGPSVERPNIITYNTVINACAERGEAGRAEGWLLRMMDQGLAPNEVTYGTICKAFARKGDVPAVERIMDAFEAVGKPLNEYFFASLISACGTAQPPNPERAERALVDMKRLGLRPHSVRRVLGAVLGERRAAELLMGTSLTSDRQEAVVDAAVEKDPGYSAPCLGSTRKCRGRRRGGSRACAMNAA